MGFEISKIKLSNKDKHKEIRIPSNLCTKLAELIGILVGDGHVGRKLRPDGKSYYNRIDICGNIRDMDHMRHIKSLFKEIFNVEMHLDIINKKNCFVLRKQSQAMGQFFQSIIGIPRRKSNILVPPCIMNGNEKIKIAFLRGLADTDFCLTHRNKPNIYPVIHGTSISETLIKDCSNILEQLGIDHCCSTEYNYYKKREKTYINHRVYINGFKRVEKYMKIIGFSNPIKNETYTEILNNRKLSTIKHTPKKFR
jgi:intein/homing endonuclease